MRNFLDTTENRGESDFEKLDLDEKLQTMMGKMVELTIPAPERDPQLANKIAKELDFILEEITAKGSKYCFTQPLLAILNSIKKIEKGRDGKMKELFGLHMPKIRCFLNDIREDNLDKLGSELLEFVKPESIGNSQRLKQMEAKADELFRLYDCEHEYKYKDEYENMKNKLADELGKLTLEFPKNYSPRLTSTDTFDSIFKILFDINKYKDTSLENKHWYGKIKEWTESSNKIKMDNRGKFEMTLARGNY